MHLTSSTACEKSSLSNQTTSSRHQGSESPQAFNESVYVTTTSTGLLPPFSSDPPWHSHRLVADASYLRYGRKTLVLQLPNLPFTRMQSGKNVDYGANRGELCDCGQITYLLYALISSPTKWDLHGINPCRVEHESQCLWSTHNRPGSTSGSYLFRSTTLHLQFSKVKNVVKTEHYFKVWATNCLAAKPENIWGSL